MDEIRAERPAPCGGFPVCVRGHAEDAALLAVGAAVRGKETRRGVVIQCAEQRARDGLAARVQGTLLNPPRRCRTREMPMPEGKQAFVLGYPHERR